MPTKAELEADLAALKAEHEALKVNVVETARAYAEEHEWCGVVDEALAEMGLELPPEIVQVTVKFDLREYARFHEITTGEVRQDISDRLAGFSWSGTGVESLEVTDLKRVA
jgi:hypothetical protein